MIPPNPLKDGDVARVEKGLSEMLQKKGVNVNLDLVLYDWGTSADKIGTMLGPVRRATLSLLRTGLTTSPRASARATTSLWMIC